MAFVAARGGMTVSGLRLRSVSYTGKINCAFSSILSSELMAYWHSEGSILRFGATLSIR